MLPPVPPTGFVYPSVPATAGALFSPPYSLYRQGQGSPGTPIGATASPDDRRSPTCVGHRSYFVSPARPIGAVGPGSFTGGLVCQLPPVVPPRECGEPCVSAVLVACIKLQTRAPCCPDAVRERQRSDFHLCRVASRASSTLRCAGPSPRYSSTPNRDQPGELSFPQPLPAPHS
ncbi:hypothetical protein NDU88_007150 [Pleurodeles waltl]|uniref:Uncharacterized protein n=1 Tax=Pleurodeles waltl TaxID=8319 RepID=A0AAV7TZU7_PLEWA|nr:hypothetical protein NDU88_007150 [Pleurodeles waltl]